MKKKVVVLSCFDGISCAQIALNHVLPKGVEYVYYASEINLDSMLITTNNYPGTIHLGDIRNITRDMIPYDDIFMITAGSPCQDFSMTGRQKGMMTTENIEITTLEQYLDLKNSGFEFIGQSYLFWEFMRITKEFNPKYFLLENVRMGKKWENVITRSVGISPIRINSNLISAQNRDRYYWTNIPSIRVPKDKGIILSNVIPGARAWGERGVKNKNGRGYTPTATIRTDGKSNCLTCTNSLTQKIILPDGNIRHLTVVERELLQTLPVGYTNVMGITKTARIHATGNCWTVDVIKHIFEHIPKFA
jgi:DNA (cytosine-5)-methyltransferase 3A